MTRSLARMMADPAVPVIGDLLRLAFHASRHHPDRDVRDGVGVAIDKMLAATAARAHGPDEIARFLGASAGNALAPMVADRDDLTLAARFWRYCAFAFVGYQRLPGRPVPLAELFLGSADAVGAGHGVRLNPMSAEFHERGERLPSIPYLRLGMARSAARVALPECGDVAALVVDPRHGITVDIRLAKSPGRDPGVPPRTWIAPLGRAEGGYGLPDLARIGLKAEMPSALRLRILAATPEGAIRLAAACADRAAMRVGIDVLPENSRKTKPGWRVRGPFDVLVRLAPIDQPEAALACVRYSCVGDLAEWMDMPVLPLAPDIAPELRAAIAAAYGRT
jgi:hypothetical protein